MTALTKKRILLADPDMPFRVALARTLKFKGYSVDQAASVQQMLHLLSKVPVSLVVIDIRMPETDGISLIRQLRQKFPDTHIIILSAGANVETTIEAVKLGVKDYLLKPIATGDILTAIDMVLHTRSNFARQPVASQSHLRAS